MDAIEAIAARRSVARLLSPGPSESDLDSMFRAAMAAPDHRGHRPWRFVLLQDDAKTQFGKVLLDAFLAQCASRKSEPSEDAKKKELTKLDRAPLVIIACAKYEDDPKAPRDEQLAAVACAVQNLLITATSLGYGSMWRTGDAARDPLVKAALGLRPSDDIVGFLYLGTTPEEDRSRPDRPDTDEFVSSWHPAV